jgi:membrane protease YdiL (CAAX protease family)
MSAIPVTSSETLATEPASGGWVRKHPVLAMYVLMFALAWVVLVPEALASRGLLPFQMPMALSFLTGWAPAIAALVVTGQAEGRTGVRNLLGRFLIFRVGLRWYAVALSLIAVAILGGIGLHVLFGGAMPVIPVAGAPAATVIFAFVVTMLLGILLNTEEVAWRGFALPRLQARHGALVAALQAAVPESLLHLPYFFNKDVDFYQNVGLISFTVFSIALSVLYAWMFNNTKGSLVLVTLLHASQNTWANLLSDNTARPFYFTVILLSLLAVAVVLVFGPARLSRQIEAGK